MLVEITQEAFDVEIDLIYALDRNFTGAPVYTRAAAFLHTDAAEKLRAAVALARPLGYRLRIHDAFRPSEAQWALWNHTPDPEFLADPRRGSPHSRGVAVDVTLIDGAGQALDMGTGVDTNHADSHHGVTTLPAEVQRNRALLLGIMTAADWDWYRNEWWHYQLFDPRRYPVLTDAEAGTNMM